MSNWIQEAHESAAQKVKDILAKPMQPDPMCQSVDDFDPWEIFPNLYGNYSDDFDQAALLVLRNLSLAANDQWEKQDLASEGLPHHMLREMLCNLDLCEYGTSPRVCFASHSHFAPLLPELIEKWEAWSKIMWVD